MVEIQSMSSNYIHTNDVGTNKTKRIMVSEVDCSLTPTSTTLCVSPFSESEGEFDKNSFVEERDQQIKIGVMKSKSSPSMPTTTKKKIASKEGYQTKATSTIRDSPLCSNATTSETISEPHGLKNHQHSEQNETRSDLGHKYATLENRITKLESSLQEILQLLKQQQEQKMETNIATEMKQKVDTTANDLSFTPTNEPEKNKKERVKKPNSPPTVEYRTYSPTYEEGLRREIQSRSRSNTMDSNHSLKELEQAASKNSSNNNTNTVDNHNQSKGGNVNLKTIEAVSAPLKPKTINEKSISSDTISGKPPLHRPPPTKTLTSLSQTDAATSSHTIAPSKNLDIHPTQIRVPPIKSDTVITTVTKPIPLKPKPATLITSENTQYSILKYIQTEILGDGVTQTTPKTSISIQQTDASMEEFRRVPYSLEQLLFFGLAICIDSYLYVLTFLPLKFLWSIFRGLVTLSFPNIKSFRFHRRHMYQLLQGSIIYIVYTQILLNIQIGIFYHWIRGQAMIKLYVLIAIVEVFDRLMCSFGQDAQDSLYWNTIMRPKTKRLFVSWLVVLCYAIVHSLILFVHVATLNVAMNSADQALLTLLVSGNFAEIKSTVFKKYNNVTLFNITMSDICERFKLALFLMLILLLNISQGGVTIDMAKNYLGMCAIILIAEFTADWTKHSFIAKLNSIQSKAYQEYALVLARDVTGMGHEGINLNHTHAVVKRIGFAQFPLICVMARYLREAARYAWMRSEKLGMLQNWFCEVKTLFTKEQICVIEEKEWGCRETIVVVVVSLIGYMSLLTLKIIFGYLLQKAARNKLLNDDHEAGGTNSDAKGSKTATQGEAKRQII